VTSRARRTAGREPSRTRRSRR